jgi:hypothetical protein
MKKIIFLILFLIACKLQAQSDPFGLAIPSNPTFTAITAATGTITTLTGTTSTYTTTNTTNEVADSIKTRALNVTGTATIGTINAITYKQGGTTYDLSTFVATGSNNTFTGVNTFTKPLASSTATLAITPGSAGTINQPSGVVNVDISGLSALNALTTTTAQVNDNLVTTNSKVIAVIQNYTGTFFTDGIPIIAEINVASGNFVLILGNAAAVAPTNGIVTIIFYVIN